MFLFLPPRSRIRVPEELIMKHLLTIALLGLTLSVANAEEVLTSAPPAAPRARTAPPKTTAKLQSNKAQKKSAEEPLNMTPGLTRIKDIAEVQGVRGNQLVGYGLVVGLEGSGDGQQSLFTVQSVMNMLRKSGVTLGITPQQLQVKNVAAVMVTADLPPFAKNGSRFDVNVSSIGDAKSLQGGTLIRTPLLAANGEIYAVAQGPLSIGGFNFSAGGTSVQKNFVNVGRIPNGATVEQEVPVTLSENGLVQITLREPDFTTVSRIASALRKEKYNANALDAATVSVGVPQESLGDIIGFIAAIENISVTPDSQAKIIINERTGTVVMGSQVRLAPGAVAHGSISIRIDNTPVVIPPAPFNPNPGQVVPLQDTQVKEQKSQLALIPATTTVDQLVRAMNKLGVTPRDLINILQAMRSAHMINAAIEVQ